MLLEAFQDPHPLSSIPTWEDVCPLPESTEMEASESRALLEQFADLGYIERPRGNPSAEAELSRSLPSDVSFADRLFWVPCLLGTRRIRDRKMIDQNFLIPETPSAAARYYRVHGGCFSP